MCSVMQDEARFVAKFPEAQQSYGALLKAINCAREARGQLQRRDSKPKTPSSEKSDDES